MAKIKVKKPNRRQALLICALLLLIAGVGVTIYALQELKGLRARVHTLEYARGQDMAAYNNNAPTEKVDYAVISKTTKTVRVEDTNNSSYGEGPSSVVYKDKKVVVYRIKVTNNTSWTYDYTEGDIKGKTAEGSLIMPINYSVHADDRQGRATLSLAPGGTAELYIYLPADESIVDLYYQSGSAF